MHRYAPADVAVRAVCGPLLQKIQVQWYVFFLQLESTRCVFSKYSKSKFSKNTTDLLSIRVATCFDSGSHHQANYWTMFEVHQVKLHIFGIPKCLQQCENVGTIKVNIYNIIYRMFNLKVDRILIWVIYLLRFIKCYITQLTCIYSKCWKWCPFISVHLSTRFTTFLATFLSVLSFTSSMARVIFIFKILNFWKELCLQWA